MFSRIFLIVTFLFFFISKIDAQQIAWYVAFSDESNQPINNIYALNVATGAFEGAVLPTNLSLQEIRNAAVGPDGNLYVVNSNKNDSRIVEFGPINPDGITRNYIASVVTPANSYGLIHPYQVAFSPNGDLYVSVQDANVVLRFYGPLTVNSGQALPLASFLQAAFPGGVFAPGTFAPAYSAAANIPFTAVPPDQGGLTNNGAYSVRGIAFGPNHTLYVSDEGNDRVAVYNTQSGQLINLLTSPLINKPDQLFYNMNSHLIYIACPGSRSVVTYDPSTNTINPFITDSKHLKDVSGIAFGEDGNFYAADRDSMSIHKYDSNGNYLGLFAGPFTDSPEGLIPVYATYPTKNAN